MEEYLDRYKKKNHDGWVEIDAQTDLSMDAHEESRILFQGVTNPQEIFKHFLENIALKRIIDRSNEKITNSSQNKLSHKIRNREISVEELKKYWSNCGHENHESYHIIG